jgi:outer membrane protein OmpA-like peptidoglycan-associated protein
VIPETKFLVPFTGPLNGYKVYVQGSLPSRDLYNRIVNPTRVVLGSENVIGDVKVDSSLAADNAGEIQFVDTGLFDSGSTVLKPYIRALLDISADYATQHPSVVITVIGHADSRGSLEDNLVLSTARADRIIDYMLQNGVRLEQLRGEARGETEPVADEGTPEGLAANRRVEILISGVNA